MSYQEVLSKMKSNVTHGEEFGLTKEQAKETGTIVGHTHCEYCGKDILAIWDKFSSSHWFPYLGNQARKPQVYRYSPIIQAMRKHYGVENAVWREENGNNLLNVHARSHSTPVNWAIRASSASIRLLCNECFQKTYRRTKIQGNDGILYDISVLPERGETVDSVMKELGIEGVPLGSGGLKNYQDPK